MNKMLLFQNDYLAIDAEASGSITKNKDHEIRSAMLYITIQCNGKLRRTVNRLFLRRSTDEVLPSDGWTFENYDVLYTIFQMLNDLGYDIPTGQGIHPIMNKFLFTL